MYIQPKLNKPLLIFFKLLVYTAIFFSFQALTTVIFARPQPEIAFILSMLLIVANRGKLTETLQRFVDKNFYYALYQRKQYMQQFNQKLNSTLDYEQLVNYLINFFENTIGRDYYEIYLNRGSSFNRIIRAQSGVSVNKVIQHPRRKRTDHTVFKVPIRIYTLPEAAQKDPFSEALIKNHLKSGRFHYFLPLKGSDRIMGFILFNRAIKPDLQNPQVRVDLLHLFQKTAYILEKAQIYNEVKRKSLESELLLDIVRKISSTLHLEAVLDSIVENISRLVSCDAAAIFLVDKERRILEQKVARGYENQGTDLISLKFGQGITGKVIQTREGLNLPDVRKNPHYYPARPQTKSQITVPIISRNSAIGALALESNELHHFSNEDLELLTFFSSLVAISIRNAKLYEDSLKKKRLENELLVASQIQKTLLPKRVPSIAGIDIEVLNIPSRIVGGDLYDVFKIDHHGQAIAIGDVSGKGAPAALLMAVAYAGFKSLLKDIDPVATVVARLNNFMVEATTSGYYVTFFYGIFDSSTSTFTYCNAGHNAPILLRKDRSIEYLDKGGTVLGFLADQHYVQTALKVESGDYICLYTDGVTEITNNKEEEFGEERLAALLKENYGKSSRDLKLAIVEALKKFAESVAFQDDVTLLIVRID